MDPLLYLGDRFVVESTREIGFARERIGKKREDQKRIIMHMLTYAYKHTDRFSL